MITRTLIVLATLTAVTACGSLQEPGSPKQSFSIQEDIIRLQTASDFAATITDYYCIGKPKPCPATQAVTASTGTPPTLDGVPGIPVPAPSGANPNNANLKEDQKSFRNKFIAFRMVTINLHYVEFVREVAVNKAQLDTALDVLNLGLTLSSTVVGGPATAAILSAAAAGVAGARISYDKNFFFEKTVAVLVTAMNAERKTALVPIIEGIGKNIDEYRFEQAITDLHIYYESGTFNGALQAIQKDAGLKEVEADIKIIEVQRSRQFLQLGGNFADLAAAVDTITSKKDILTLIFDPIFTKDPTTLGLINQNKNPAAVEGKLTDGTFPSARAEITGSKTDEIKSFLKQLIMSVDRSDGTFGALQSRIGVFAQ